MLKKEAFSTYSHGIMAILCGIGGIILVFLSSGNIAYQIICAQASLTAVLSMGSSALYHSKKLAENENNWRRKLDHIAIFFGIAGYFTCLSSFYLSSPWRWILISVLWICVAVGFLLKLFFLNAPRWLSPIIYFGMALIAIIPLPIYLSSMSVIGVVLFFLGGISFVIGGVVYAIKKPDPKPGIFGFHDIFHICIASGMGLFYFIILDIILALSVG